LFKVNHLGKVKSSYMLDHRILTEAKIQATKVHLTVSNIIEQALTEYLQSEKQKEKGEEKERARLFDRALQKEKQRSTTTTTTTSKSTPTFNFG
jgi:dsDNA-specific endonuclease/ATPase MutS2